jgi:hypothetical protein
MSLHLRSGNTGAFTGNGVVYADCFAGRPMNSY